MNEELQQVVKHYIAEPQEMLVEQERDDMGFPVGPLPKEKPAEDDEDNG